MQGQALQGADSWTHMSCSEKKQQVHRHVPTAINRQVDVEMVISYNFLNSKLGLPLLSSLSAECKS